MQKILRYWDVLIYVICFGVVLFAIGLYDWSALKAGLVGLICIGGAILASFAVTFILCLPLHFLLSGKKDVGAEPPHAPP